jgi:adenylate cyclase
VSGDSVNVASRLMDLAKTHGAMLAVSAEFLAARGESAGRHREPDEVRTVEIRGRRKSMSVAFWSMRSL